MVDAYERMMESPISEETSHLWERIVAYEKALYQHVRLRIGDPAYESAPCPFCGEALRTSRAKQCRHCGRDWRDPDQVIPLNPVGSPERTA